MLNRARYVGKCADVAATQEEKEAVPKDAFSVINILCPQIMKKKSGIMGRRQEAERNSKKMGSITNQLTSGVAQCNVDRDRLLNQLDMI